MQSVGQVVAVTNNVARVRFERTKACGKCRACLSFGETQAEVELPNTLHAKVGDWVEISLHEGEVAKASLLAYGIPLAGLVAGVLLGSLWGEIAAVFCGLLFALGGFGVLKLLEPKFSRMGSFAPRMIRIKQ